VPGGVYRHHIVRRMFPGKAANTSLIASLILFEAREVA
jgi:hypothetical protein